MIQFHQDIVYLEDELDYIEYYLDLQKFRFGDKLCILMDVPPSVLYLGIPKFTIQPIVENALTHGIPQSGEPLIIRISLLIRENTLRLSVSDNGIGISDDTLKNLQQHIAGTRTDSSFGVALRNVHMRIQLLFGKEYGLTIDSRLYNGTTVLVTLPAIDKKEMEKYV